MSTGIVEFGFDDGDDGLGSKIERFKAKKGVSYRMSLAWWEEKDGRLDMTTPTPKFIGARRLYHKDVGYFISQGPEYEKLVGEQARMAIATAIILWPTDENGALEKERFQAGSGIKVMPWVISNDKYQAIKRRHNEWPLGSHDLLVTCTDDQYQKLDISSARDNLLQMVMANEKGASLRNKLLEQLRAVVAGMNNIIGREMTLEQLREKISGQAPTGPVASVMPSAQIDSILDGMLDEDD